MKPLPLLSLLLLKFQGTIGITITNTLNNSSPLIGESITLSCNIAGGRAGIVSWWKDKYDSQRGTYVTYNCSVVKAYKSRLRNVQCDMNNYNFQLSNVQTSDSGNWACEADGQEATTKLGLDILVPPKVQIKTSKTTVNEHEFVRFECVTSGGNPEHIERYQWLWNKGNTTTAQVIQDRSTSTGNWKFLEFARIPYDKSGIYTCKAWNIGGMGQAATVLNVQYSPRIDPEAMKCDVAGEIGNEATFELFLTANPFPVANGYVWSKDGEILPHSTPEYEIISGPTFSMLKVKNVTASDYTTYTCSVKTTRFEEKVFKFMLLKAGPPYVPSELEVVNSTAVAATLKWISEFNGGYEQRFYVQYKKSAQNWNVASEVPQGGITDPGCKKVVYYRVTNLQSNDLYVFRVQSKNSRPGIHTSTFSNKATGKTPEKPQTSLIGVKRAHDIVTVRWKQVIGKYTTLKIRYCQTGTENCKNYTVPNPDDNIAAIYIDADKTYYYHMIIEDGGEVVYRSPVYTAQSGDLHSTAQTEVDSTPQTEDVDFKTNTVLAVVCGLVGAGIVAITVIIVAIVLWKRRLVQWGKKQSHRSAKDTTEYDDTRISENQGPINDTVEYYNETRVELATIRRGSIQTNDNIGTEGVNDAFPLDGTPDYEPPQTIVMGHPVPVHRVLGNEPAYPNDDVDAYDYVDSPRTWEQSFSGENPAPEPQEDQTEDATAFEQFGQNDSSGENGGQERQEPGAADSSSKLFVEEQPGQSIAQSKNQESPYGQRTAKSSSSHANLAHKQSQSCSDEDTAHDEESLYTHLGAVAPVKHGEYLDLKQPRKE